MYNLIRRLLFACGVILTSPLILLAWLESTLTDGKGEKMFGSAKELLAAIPTFIGEYLRAAFYWAVCRDVSIGVMFLYGSMIAHRDTTIRPGCLIGVHSIVGYADIGANVMLGARVSILSGKYQHGRPASDHGLGSAGEYSRVSIGDHSWIGEGALILAPVGKNCTVGAGSVVYKEVPDHSTVLGNPARKVSM